MTTLKKVVAGTVGATSVLAGALALFVTRTRTGYNRLMETVYENQFPDVRTISPDELAAALQAPHPPILLDARSPEEYAVSHIRNAQLVNPATFSRDDVDDIERDREVVVYCSVGYRSGRIARRMRQMGFTKVSNLHGGLFRWFNEGRPVFRRDVEVDTVHPYDWLWGQFITRGGKSAVP